MPNFCMHIKTQKALFLFLIVLTAGCGGGASPAGSSANSATAPTSQGSTSNTNSTSESLDFVSFWNQTISNEYSNVGTMTGYSYKDFRNVSLQSKVISIDKANQITTLEITQNNHGAQNGDILYLSGINKSLHGISSQNYNSSFSIELKNLDVYRIIIKGIASQPVQENFFADVTYKYKECTGKQNINQSPVELTTILVDGYTLYKTRTEVNTVLNNCSPPLSQFVTNRYYKMVSCSNCLENYQLVRQEIVGGIYSEPDSKFKIPDGLIKIGDSGQIGTLNSYSNSTRVNNQGKSVISYETYFEGCCSPVVVVKSKTYDSNGVATVEVKDYYSKIIAKSEVPYSLIKTVASYFNLNRNEMVVEFSSKK